MAHQLHIQIIDSVDDSQTMTVLDLSAWDERIPVSNRLLQVLPPGYSDYRDVLFPVQGVVLTAKSLNLYNWETCNTLPDGLYKFRYSVNPNATCYKMIEHFRMSEIGLNLVSACIDHLESPVNEINDCGTPVYSDNEIKLSNVISKLGTIPALVSGGRQDLATRYYDECLTILSRMKQPA